MDQEQTTVIDVSDEKGELLQKETEEFQQASKIFTVLNEKTPFSFSMKKGEVEFVYQGVKDISIKNDYKQLTISVLIGNTVVKLLPGEEINNLDFSKDEKLISALMFPEKVSSVERIITMNIAMELKKPLPIHEISKELIDNRDADGLGPVVVVQGPVSVNFGREIYICNDSDTPIVVVIGSKRLVFPPRSSQKFKYKGELSDMKGETPESLKQKVTILEYDPEVEKQYQPLQKFITRIKDYVGNLVRLE
ncbi:hypothetical protein K9L27_02410 [Candidatus Gracilibacteria bacterium]|nr:hypothetical protein [Candidatus Gracilibacteria bacterium]